MRSIPYPRRVALLLIVPILVLIGAACDPNDPAQLQAFYDLNPEVGAEVTHETLNEPQRAVISHLQDQQLRYLSAVHALEDQRRALQMDPFLVCVRRHESDRGAYPHVGGYHIGNSHGQSTSSGAYQFVDGTWRNASRLAGYPGYARALHAPWWVQDAVAHHLASTGGRSAWAGTGCPGT